MATDEADFMKSLFADLDASVFSSQHSAVTTPCRPLSQKRHNVILKKTPSKLSQANKKAVKHVAVEIAQPKQESLDTLCDGIDWSEADIDVDLNTVEEPQHLPKPPISRDYVRYLIRSVEEDYLHPVTCKTSKLLVAFECSGRSIEKMIYLQDDWYATEVQTGSFINILGPITDDQDIVLSFSNNLNYLILHPDTLITATAVSTSVPCARRPLLQDRLRATGQTSEPLLYGNLLHELLQTCLLKNTFTEEFRRSIITNQMAREDNLISAWELEKEVEDVIEEVMSRSTAWSEWSNIYIGTEPKKGATLIDRRASQQHQNTVCLSEIHDIEEDIWSPRLGMKGKIDVSVQARIQSATGGQYHKKGSVMPFEIKTGRSIAGIEHRAQTMLYTLLMSDRYNEEINTGLLLYTQCGEVHLVEQAKNELRGLIQARNMLASYTVLRSAAQTMPQSAARDRDPGQMSIPASEADLWDSDNALSEAAKEEAILPQPLDDMKSCKRCYQADSCMLYRKAIESHVIPDDDPMLELYRSKTAHLRKRHLQFFKKWERLVSLEEKELVHYRKEMWNISASEREDLGRCLADMSIDASFQQTAAVDQSRIHRYSYRFTRSSASFTGHSSTQARTHSLLSSVLSTGDAVVVSMINPDILAVARGFVLQVKPYHIILGLDRSLEDLPCTQNRRQPKEKMFRIDKDELSAGLGRLRDNLAQLFYVEGDAKRRELIVDLRAPRFEEEFVEKWTAPSHLNTDQKNAVELVLKARDYALVLGMPGTGKSTTIVEIILALTARKKTILLTSYTHSAVDNILLKLLTQDVDVLRIGNADKVHPQVRPFTLGSKEQCQSISDLNDRFMGPKIVACTALSINHALFAKRTFDYCIVDEASQIPLPVALGPLRFCDKFILVGDHFQLPPLVKNPQAREEGYETSLFKLLSESSHARQATAELRLQYRMNTDIMSISNTLYYSRRMVAGTSEVGNQKLFLPQFGPSMAAHHSELICDICWLAHVLSASTSVSFINTDALDASELKKGRMITNEVESVLILQTVRALVDAGLDPSKIGVIALYRQQIKLLAKTIGPQYSEVEIMTADQSQGRDKSVILISFTRSNEGLHTGDLLKDWRRLNVCFTRAKSKLIMFGSRMTLAEPLKELFALLEGNNWIFNLSENADAVHQNRKRAISYSLTSQDPSSNRRVLSKIHTNSPRR